MSREAFRQVSGLLDGSIAPQPMHDQTQRHEQFGRMNELAHALDPRERSELLPLAWVLRCAPPGIGDNDGDIRKYLASQIEFDKREPVITAALLESCLSALLEIRRNYRPVLSAEVLQRITPEEMRESHIRHLLHGILPHLDELPTPEGRRLLLEVLDGGASGDELNELVARRIAGDQAGAAVALAQVIARIEGDLARREMELLAGADTLSFLRGVGEIHSYHGGQSERARIDRALALLSAAPGYEAFAAEVFAMAAARLSDLAEGRVPYKADSAFPVADCDVIGRAALFGLALDRDWCLDALGPIWRMAVVAPDPKAKTMPSQSISIRLGHATVAEPRAQALLALREATSICRHAGVKKKLDRMRSNARIAFAAMPERLLDLDPDEPIGKDLARPFRDAVEFLLVRPQPMAAGDWLARLGPARKGGWEIARALIWELVAADGGRITAMPEAGRGGGAPVWRLVDGSTRPFDGTDGIRLWHPVEAPEDLVRDWRIRVQGEGISQPFLQLGREIFRPSASEMRGRSIDILAGREIAGTPTIGVARATGWRAGYQSELQLRLAGVDFTFDAGVRNFPGAGGTGQAGALWLDGPQEMLAQVPARILSEAIRRADLLVTVGERARR